MGQRNLLTAQFDAALELKDAGSAITANGVAQVGGVNRVVNVGKAFLQATLIIDVDLMDVSSNDETYELTLQGSTTPDFSADVVNIATVKVGKATGLGESSDAGIGRYAVGFINTRDGVKPYPYLRMTHKTSGTTPSFNYRAFITKNQMA